jgi:chemotaxis protein MotB
MIHVPSTYATVLALILLSTGCAHLQPELDACNSALSACQGDLTATQARAEALQGELDRSLSAADLAERRLAAYRDLADRLRTAFGADGLEIILRNGRLVVQLPNRVLFDFGKAVLKPEGEEALTRLASVLKEVPERSFLVAGHTDNVPVSKKSTRYESNWELSTLRGVSVVQFLQAQGVAPTQLGAAGYGEYFPEASNDTEEGRAENRRTEIIIMPLLSEIPELPSDL